ncbi:GFA family protein [Candidatus Phaeomarinobacter ectocarpi]|uniref:GFA family protein n=1 Tax=Candidatus Phaeomarinibacter ectocarpi TaxID=1458461 RepID=UPI001493F112|nr:GFA family protein [Candidatus Phaeomarinobacter ectocarpi]
MTSGPTPLLAGGCSCGAVRYEISTPEINAGICHCADCQRHSGAPFVVWLGIEPEAFKLTQGDVKEFSSSKWATRGFCATCGSTLTYRVNDNTDEIDVAGGTLDDPGAAAPKFQIFKKDSPRFMQGFDETLPEKDVEAYFNGLRER